MTTKRANLTIDRMILESVTPKEPKLYKVFIYNDDQTTQEFVVEILKTIFTKTHKEAVEIMLKIHSEGIGVAGIFPYDLAKTRTSRAEELARSVNFPLQLQYKPA